MIVGLLFSYPMSPFIPVWKGRSSRRRPSGWLHHPVEKQLRGHHAELRVWVLEGSPHDCFDRFPDEEADGPAAARSLSCYGPRSCRPGCLRHNDHDLGLVHVRLALLNHPVRRSLWRMIW